MTEQLNLTGALFGEGDLTTAPAPNASVEIFKSIVDEIYSKKNIELKTELNDRQVMVFSQAKAFAKRYKVPLLKELVKNYSEYAISKNRKGRKEFSEISKSNLQMAANDDMMQKSIPQRLLGN